VQYGRRVLPRGPGWQPLSDSAVRSVIDASIYDTTSCAGRPGDTYTPFGIKPLLVRILACLVVRLIGRS